jgi:hypothetical protein
VLLSAFATRLNPVESAGVQLQVGFHSTDTGTSYGLAIRSEVAEVLASAPLDASIAIHTTEATLRGLLTGRTPWPRVFEDGAATISTGAAEATARFWSLFDPPMGEFPALALR